MRIQKYIKLISNTFFCNNLQLNKLSKKIVINLFPAKRFCIQQNIGLFFVEQKGYFTTTKH